MEKDDRILQAATRRQFFGHCGVSLGQIAQASLLTDGKMFGASAKPENPMVPKPPHFPPKVKNIIYLFMAGGPSQLELFDYKPKLQEYDRQVAPESIMKGK